MALVTTSRKIISDSFPGSQIGLKTTPKCGLEVEKLLQGGKKEPARSPEAKIVILAERYSKIWGGDFELFGPLQPQAPGPTELLSKLPFSTFLTA